MTPPARVAGGDRAARRDHRRRARERRRGRHADRPLFQDAPLCRLEGPARGPRAGLPRHPPRRRAAGLGPGRDARPCRRGSGPAALFDGSPHGPAAGRRRASRSPRPAIAPAWLLERFDPLVDADELAGAARARAARPARQPPQGPARRGAGRAARGRADAALADRAAPARRLPGRADRGLAVGPGRGPGRGQPAHLPRLRGGAGHAGGRSVRRRRRQDARARRRDGERRAGSSPATPTAAGSRALPPRARAGRRRDRRDAPARSRAGRPRRSPTWPARPISCWSTRPARAPAPGGAIPETRWRVDARAARPAGRAAGATCSTSAPGWSGPAAIWSMRSARCSPRRAGTRPRRWPAVHRWFRSRFLSRPDGPPGPGRLLSPARDGTDGFFVARWQRPC